MRKPRRSPGSQITILSAIAAVVSVLLQNPSSRAQGPLAQASIVLDRPAELTATVSARCNDCAWDVAGREAVTLRVALDDRYSQHLPLVRSGAADYTILIGPAAAGRHTATLEVDREATATALRRDGAAGASLTLRAVAATAAEYLPLSLAPIVYARPNTIGRFTDAPVFMWYEVERKSQSTRYQYSMIFTNEDGGTATDRLMATWGRTTDIEYIYSVEVDRDGTVVAEDFQGPDHKVLPFRGRREGRHPLLYVATDNNMVTDTGDVAIRYAPLPVRFSLVDQSREAVMDRNPWLYAVASKEMVREGKIGSVIPDPRRFVYIEACAEVGTAAVAFGVRVGESWVMSDNGRPEHRIVRDGCFRGAVALPDGVDPKEVTAVRVAAFARPPRNGAPAPAPTAVKLTRINKVFVLSPQYVPDRTMVEWQGSKTIAPGSHFDLGTRN